MNITLYHFNSKARRNIVGSTGSIELLEEVRKADAASQYYLVAEFDNIEGLDEAFRLSQNTDESVWSEVYETSQVDLRSTTTGDLMIMDNKVYMVDYFGFTKL